MSKLISAARVEGVPIFRLRSLRYFRNAGRTCLVATPLGLAATALLEYNGMQRDVRPNYAAMAIVVYVVGCVGAFLKLNSRLVREIVLLPNRQIQVSTVGVLRPSKQVYPLDCLLPPVASSGSTSDFQSLRIATPQGFDRYWISFKNNDMPTSGWERLMMQEIVQANLHDPKKPVRLLK